MENNRNDMIVEVLNNKKSHDENVTLEYKIKELAFELDKDLQAFKDVLNYNQLDLFNKLENTFLIYQRYKFELATTKSFKEGLSIGLELK